MLNRAKMEEKRKKDEERKQKEEEKRLKEEEKQKEEEEKVCCPSACTYKIMNTVFILSIAVLCLGLEF